MVLHSGMVCWHSLHEYVFQLPNFLLYLLTQILLQSYWGAAYVLHVLRNQSACLYDLDDVQLPLVVITISPPSSTCTATVDPTEKNPEGSSHVSLFFKCFL